MIQFVGPNGQRRSIRLDGYAFCNRSDGKFHIQADALARRESNSFLYKGLESGGLDLHSVKPRLGGKT